MPELDSIRLETNGWELVRSSHRSRLWRDAAGDCLSLDYFPVPPDLPGPDLGMLRRFFRARITASGGAEAAATLDGELRRMTPYFPAA